MKSAFIITVYAFLVIVSFVVTPVMAQQEQDPEFASKVRLVEVTLRALDGEGRHVLDLSADDLKLEANGRKRDLRLFEPVQIGLERFETLKRLGAEYRPMSAIKAEDFPPRYFMLLFHQIQFRFGTFQRAKAAAIEFVQNHMLPNDYISVVGFDKRIDFEIDFTNDKNEILNAIENMHLRQRNISMHNEFFVYLQNLSTDLAKEPYKVSIIIIAEGMQGIGRPAEYTVYDRTIAKLQAADIRIFGVDAAGLNLRDPGASVARYHSNAAAKIYQSFNLGLWSEPTGGSYYRYHNNIVSLFQQVDYEMSAYYIVGFHLDDEDEADADIGIDISTERSGVKLRYKERFKATAPVQ